MHALAPQVKLVALALFVVSVVATSTSNWWAFGVHALLLGGAITVARVPVTSLVRRMWIEVPFVVFAVLMPFVSTGPRTQLLGVTVSEPGLHAGLALLARGTLGVLASLLFAATTEAPDVVRGLDRLRLPQQLVQILGFTVRYLDVVTDQLRRMRMARESRGFTATSVRQWPVLASTAGALFIRSYERGERVHLAMLSRGYGGRMPRAEAEHVSARAWILGLTVPVLAATVAIVSHLL
ncbi:cobalt/nickel transport system permease protein [Yimella lutea]|uniref:Cobalt/nickel transport system permease protein n=1 Tax=Yimella lutea TaxID=587872 RepID=A0A542EEE2_9MICO|nr:cobalt/nickel transport system permease protein [Yimella lutea]